MKKEESKKLSEFSLIERIKEFFPNNRDIVKGIGDDCAVIKVGREYYLYTIDNMVEGVHFDISIGMDYSSIGYKAVVRAISDIVAMGGTPHFILISLLMPKGFAKKNFSLLSEGFREAVKQHNLSLIGGDISSSKILTITISAIGRMTSKPVFRSGAKKGDDIYYTGYLGFPRAGLEILKRGIKDKKLNIYIETFLRPTIRTDFGKELTKRGLANSMIDISDGFLGDLSHILEESKVGAILNNRGFDRELFKDLRKYFSEKEIDDFIFNGGDEYELIFTAEEEKSSKIFQLAKKYNIPLHKVGKITEEGLFLIKDSKKIKIIPHSFEHTI